MLFVGLGVDFGIQFSVRYRSERYKDDNLPAAFAKAAHHVAVPLSLAAMATASGFMSFLPTDYKGLSELGEIAGVGMLVAFLSSITVLPALLRLFNPPGEKEPSATRFSRRSIISWKSTASSSSSARLWSRWPVCRALLPQVRFQSDQFAQ